MQICAYFYTIHSIQSHRILLLKRNHNKQKKENYLEDAWSWKWECFRVKVSTDVQKIQWERIRKKSRRKKHKIKLSSET